MLRAGSAEVAVDMGDLAFIDSHGLQALVNLRDRCVAAGGDLLLYRPRRLALRLLDATGLRDRVRIVGAPATIAQAV